MRRGSEQKRETQVSGPPMLGDTQNNKAAPWRKDAHAYTQLKRVNVERWFAALMQREEHPNPEQARFLRDIASRCETEAQDRLCSIVVVRHASLHLQQGTSCFESKFRRR